jgi:hypothetical protein
VTTSATTLEDGVRTLHAIPATLRPIADIVVGLDSVFGAFETHPNAASVTKSKKLAHRVLDDIPAYLGDYDDVYDTRKNMDALGAPETRVIEKLVKFLKALLPAVSSPSEPSYEAATEILLKLLVTIRTLMKYTVSDDRTAACYNNMERIGCSGILAPLVSIMQIYHQRQLERQDGDVDGGPLRVLIECCHLLSVIVSSKVSAELYVKVEGSVEVLVDVMKTHGSRSADVAWTCSDVVDGLVGHSGNRSRLAAVSGFVESLVNVLKAFGPSVEIVADNLLWAIYFLTIEDADVRDKFGSTEVFSAVVDTLKGGKSIEMVAYAILGLCKDNDDNIAKFDELDAYDALEVEDKIEPTPIRCQALMALRYEL